MTDLLELVHWTARASALIFAAALALPSLFVCARARSVELFLLFVMAHTVHFAIVVSYALTYPEASIFPDGKSLTTGGGWPDVFARFAAFYVPAFFGLRARRAGAGARRWLKNADRASTLFITFMFVATYVPLIVNRSLGYAVPAAIVLAGAALYALESWGWPSESRSRRAPCH